MVKGCVLNLNRFIFVADYSLPSTDVFTLLLTTLCPFVLMLPG